MKPAEFIGARSPSCHRTATDSTLTLAWGTLIGPKVGVPEWGRVLPFAFFSFCIHALNACLRAYTSAESPQARSFMRE